MMSDYHDGPDAWERMFNRSQDHVDEQKREFAKLLADSCVDIPEVGNRIVVAIGLLGYGHPWIRGECVVTEVGNTSYKVRYKDRCEEYNWEEWVHQALVVEVLPVASERVE